MKNLVAVAVVAVGFSTTSCSNEEVTAIDMLPQDVSTLTFDVKEIVAGGGHVQGLTGDGILFLDGEDEFNVGIATFGGSGYNVTRVSDNTLQFTVENDVDSNAYMFNGTYWVSKGKFLIKTMGSQRVQLEIVN